jgi:hypothetical protein
MSQSEILPVWHMYFYGIPDNNLGTSHYNEMEQIFWFYILNAFF